MMTNFWKLSKSIIKKKLSHFGFGMLKQEAMLRLALREEGVDDKQLKIRVDHVNGKSIVNGVVLSIIYPRSFFKKAEKLKGVKKELEFYFNGNMCNSGDRKKMLKPFEIDNSEILESQYGRSIFTKIKFNSSYYDGLSRAKFGLCPHQKDFEGNEDTMWTYRFIECCLTRTIPIIFNEAPLGKEFTAGFHFFTDSEALEGNIIYSNDMVEKNYSLCIERFSLSIKEIESILNASVLV